MWEKIKQTIRSLMAGRRGMDQLSTVLIWGGLILYLLDLFLGTGVLYFLGIAVYAIALFRMMSRNHEKRAEENRRYLQMTDRLRKSVRQAKARFTNRKQYKYFKCPKCHSWIRLKRNTGSVTVRCSQCHTAFDQKA